MFKILNPILSDTNKELDSMFWHSYSSFILQQNVDENSEEEEQKQEKERANEPDTNDFNDEDVEQETPPNKTLLKRKTVTKPHEKQIVPRLQLQALSRLASGVNKIAEVNAKQVKLEQEDRKALLKFWREEVAKNWVHEKKMVQL